MARRINENREAQLLEQAFSALKAQAGIEATHSIAERREVEGFADLRGPGGEALGRYVLEVKTNVTPARLGPVAAQLNALHLAHDQPCLLVADYITPPVAHILRQMNIQFIDATGNAYLYRDDPLMHVWMIGNRPEKKHAEKPMTVFRERGLRVIFPLLCLPDAVNAPYRQLAEWSGVALGTVANTMAELDRLGLLNRTARRRSIVDRDELQRRWIEAYPQELRPRLKPQRFHVLYTNWWEEYGKARFEKDGLWLSGEPAAALLTRYLHPELVTVYGKPNLAKLAGELKAARTNDGNLELLEPFWNFEVPDFGPAFHLHRFCPPLLIYADLLATRDIRQMEAADMIREKYLAVSNG